MTQHLVIVSSCVYSFRVRVLASTFCCSFRFGAFWDLYVCNLARSFVFCTQVSDRFRFWQHLGRMRLVSFLKAETTLSTHTEPFYCHFPLFDWHSVNISIKLLITRIFGRFQASFQYGSFGYVLICVVHAQDFFVSVLLFRRDLLFYCTKIDEFFFKWYEQTLILFFSILCILKAFFVS